MKVNFFRFFFVLFFVHLERMGKRGLGIFRDGNPSFVFMPFAKLNKNEREKHKNFHLGIKPAWGRIVEKQKRAKKLKNPHKKVRRE